MLFGIYFLNIFCEVACILLLYSSGSCFLKISWLRSQRKAAISSLFILMSVRIMLLLQVPHLFLKHKCFSCYYVVLSWYNQGHSPSWNPQLVWSSMEILDGWRGAGWLILTQGQSSQRSPKSCVPCQEPWTLSDYSKAEPQGEPVDVSLLSVNKLALPGTGQSEMLLLCRPL